MQDVFFGAYTSPTESGEVGEGITHARFDSATGLTHVVSHVSVSDPSYLCLSADKTWLYGVCEGGDEPNRVFSVSRTPDGTLDKVSYADAQGTAVCHVSTRGISLAASSYGSGRIFRYTIESNGVLSLKQTVSFTGSGPNQVQQSQSRAHQTTFSPDGKFIVTCDLGSDHLWIHEVGNDGVFDKQTGVLTGSGSGPRHIAWHPYLPLFYLITELTGEVVTFEYQGGQVREVRRAESQPGAAESPWGGAIRVHPTGRSLVVSNRRKNHLVFFALAKDGEASLAQTFDSGGRVPRDAAFDATGEWLLAAHQDSGEIVTHGIDPHTGMSTGVTSETLKVARSVCVCFG